MKRSKTNLLWRSSIRFLLQHPWHFALSILGVALGVSMVVSIDLSNSSAQKAFSLSTQAVTGEATHQVTGAADGLDESVYRQLRMAEKPLKSAPVVEGYGRLSGVNRTFRILGVDPIAEAPFRSFASQKAGINLSDFISGETTGLVSHDVASELGLAVEDTLMVSVSGHTFPLRLIGLINPDNDQTRRALENLLVVDIGTAQKLLNMPGKLSRIDLILPENTNERAIKNITTLLPEGADLSRSDSRSQAVSQMINAFEFNLQALSMLALLVGMFLIYNTMTFSVVQRRPLIGRLRALGVTKREILRVVVQEAILIGVIGTAIGILAGFFLAQVLLKLVTQSINDLYFVVSVQELSIGIYPLIKAAVLGMGATLLAAYWPAREASNAEVSTVLNRSSSESKIKGRIGTLALTGIVVGGLGGGLLLIPNGRIGMGYVSLLLIIIGFSLTIPLLVTALTGLIRPVLSTINGLIGKMSAQGIVTELSRTSVAIASLVVAVAATVGVGVMVDSFRTTVVSWLETQLKADVYVQVPRAVTRKADGELDPTVVLRLKQTDGVAGFHTVRSVDVHTNFGIDQLVAVDNEVSSHNTYQMKESEPGFWNRFRNEAIVMVSEVYAYRHHVDLGDSVFIRTDRGRAGFQVAGIFYDYASDLGTITISRNTYDAYFDDPAVSGLALYATDGVDVDELVKRLRSRSEGLQEVLIQSNRGLREASIAIFDRTFTVTIVLRMLAMLVAFIGVLSALMAIQLERKREHAVMRANGMTPGQLWSYVITQSGAMGLIAGILSLPLGIIMAYILVYVINLRSFGWTLQLMVSPALLMQAVLLAFLAALLAGIYPSYKMAKASPADALRNN